MKKSIFVIVSVLLLISAACSSAGSGQSGSDSRGSSSGNANQSDSTEEIFEDCTGNKKHDVATGIAETYEVPYKSVIKWFCDGSTFSDIMLALETSDLLESEVTVDELLARRLNGETWNEIWDDYGVMDQ